MEVLIGTLYVGLLVYLANRQQVTGTPERLLNPMLYGLVGFMGFLGVSLFLARPAEADAAMTLNPVLSAAALVVSLGGAGASYLFVSSAVVRLRIAGWIQRTGQSRFDVMSVVHIVALVLMIFVLVMQFMQFVVLGGLAGVVAFLDEVQADIPGLITDMLVNVLLALLGVGLWLRRNEAQTADRLGLTLPSLREIGIAIAAGVGLHLLVVPLTMLLSAFTPEDVLELQSLISERMLVIYGDSLFVGFMVALTASIGEEILYRGALQPVFGVLLTTLFFAVMHIQYTLTPASVVIFIVGLGFALLRQRYSTTTAILAHFVYNFVPFVLLLLLPAGSL